MSLSLGGTAYAFDASAGASLSSGAFDTDPVAGSAVFVLITYTYDSTELVNSVADNASGNTFSIISGTVSTGIGGSQRSEMWVAHNVNTTSGYAVTVGWNSSTFNPSRSVHGITVLGAAASNSVDVVGEGGISSAPDTTDGITYGSSFGTPTTDNQLVLALLILNSGPDTVFPGTGYTALSITGFNAEYNRAEYLIQTTAAPVQPTWTTDNGSTNMAISAVSIKGPSGISQSGTDGAKASDSMSYLVRPAASTCRIVGALG